MWVVYRETETGAHEYVECFTWEEVLEKYANAAKFYSNLKIYYRDNIAEMVINSAINK